MTNKEIIRKVNAGFQANDADAIMEHVADNVRWDVVGYFTAIGKDEFRANITNDAFIPPPTITHLNEVEEGNKIAVEGYVKCKMKNGTMFEANFFDFYILEKGKIKEMRSYLIPKKAV